MGYWSGHDEKRGTCHAHVCPRIRLWGGWKSTNNTSKLHTQI
nr:unnamed protein product [Callosobruchus chinensis]